MQTLTNSAFLQVLGYAINENITITIDTKPLLPAKFSYDINYPNQNITTTKSINEENKTINTIANNTNISDTLQSNNKIKLYSIVGSNKGQKNKNIIIGVKE